MAGVVSKRTARSATAANQLRIIGGRWRGMRIAFPQVKAIRPSPDRVRETLFNWLQPHIAGAACLDLFAGSGALGLEALSRGAAHVTFVDSEAQVGQHLAAALRRLGSSEAQIHVESASGFLRRPPRRFDIVFLDPPFASGSLPPMFEALAQGWLGPDALVYVESPAGMPLPPLPASWLVHRAKRAGQVGYHLLRTGHVSPETAILGTHDPAD